jgi:Tol biopolymer transport system component
MKTTSKSISLAIALLAAPAYGQVTTRVSVDSSGTQGNALAGDAVLSADGRYDAFYSDATNMVVGDTNVVRDVFVRDRVADATTRMSVDSAGTQGNALSSGPSISADGRYVAFYSDATNLVAGDTNAVRDAFVHDRLTGSTVRVSVDSGGIQGNALSSGPWISADGRYVGFYSDATNLVAGDTNAFRDVFVHDLQTGITTRVSVSSLGVQGNALSSGPSISADDRYVVFYSDATNLIAADTNLVRDVFVYDRTTGVTTRESVDSNGMQSNGKSSEPVISADGGSLAFYSDATNLVSGDTNLVRDVFVHDRQTGATVRASVDSSGVQANADSSGSEISGDGRIVAFYSDATNLVAGDTNLVRDAFIKDLQTGATSRVSVDSNGAQGNALSSMPWISTDGRALAFYSDATNLVAGDTNVLRDAFVHGPELTLDVEPLIATAGQTITFATFKGPPGNLASLWVVKINNTNLFKLLFLGSFAANGNFTLAGTVPPGVAGNTIVFRGLAIGQAGKVLPTNDVTVSFQ